MPTLSLKIRLNPGRKGVFLSKLSRVGKETERFLRLLSHDLKFESKGRNWIATKFRNQSVAFTVEQSGQNTKDEVVAFNEALLIITDFEPDKGDQLNGLSTATLKQFAKMVEPLDGDEQLRIGVFSKLGSNRAKWKSLTKERAGEIDLYLNETVQFHGALQGTIHGLIIGGQPLQFDLREITTGTLVKCFVKEELYNKVIKILKDRGALVNLSGHIEMKRASRKVEQVWVDKIEPAEKYLDGDLEKFFGCAPNITGDLSTEEYVDRGRDDDNGFPDLH